MEKNQIDIVVRWRFRKPLQWRAAMELVKRESCEIVDKKSHLLWEWIAISKKI